ncbi:MAG TPA: triose-phosphate isomerase [Thermoleophilaceae bacterium]|nr:triose-phosphate isomerase [Thermoleophilaceae bacterium]
MPDRRPYVAGNWKMHKTAREARLHLVDLASRLPGLGAVDVGVCVPFTALAAAAEAAREAGGGIRIAAQNMHQEPEGAYTGEVSAPMLLEVGADGVVLGHSERRRYSGETDRALQAKVPAALGAGLEPILCVGESEEERDSGDTQRRLRHQVQEALEDVPDDRLGDVVIAYEPVWAIGTGRVATPEQAEDAIAFLRALVGDRSDQAAPRTRILYGGSVTPDNAADLLSQPDVDGALVGGASLEAESLAAIARAAAGEA